MDIQALDEDAIPAALVANREHVQQVNVAVPQQAVRIAPQLLKPAIYNAKVSGQWQHCLDIQIEISSRL